MDCVVFIMLGCLTDLLWASIVGGSERVARMSRRRGKLDFSIIGSCLAPEGSAFGEELGRISDVLLSSVILVVNCMLFDDC